MQVANQIGPVIDSLATRLKMPTEFVYHAMRRQVYVDLVMSLIFAFVVALVWKIYVPFAKKYHNDMDWDAGVFIGGIILCIGTLISSIILIICIGHALNPDYAVIHEILESIGGK